MYTCQKCGYQWEPRKKDPKCCPECKSRGWKTKKQVGKANKKLDSLAKILQKRDVEIVYDE